MQKAGELSRRWELLRLCGEYIKENSNSWKKRSLEETRRIKEEEKSLRLEIAGMKKVKYQTGNNKKEEIAKIKMNIEKK